MASLVISKEAKKAANLRVLQRADSNIVDIIASATHVVLYKFDAGSQAWEKQNVEGSLFVAKRSSFPHFKIIVMNRNSKENLEVPLAATFQMQVREPYLMFRMEKGNSKESSQEIRGIWFHDGKERQTIVDILNRVVKQLSAAPANVTAVEEKKPKQNVQTKPQGINKEEATASLMAALKIGGSGAAAAAGSVASQKAKPKPSPSPSAPKPQETSSLQNMVLDKKSLQLSLMSLLHEDKFLDLIHAQYLKVAKARENGGTPRK